RATCRVDLFLVFERDWLQRKDRFARLIHWLDRFFEPCRRGQCPEFPLAVYPHRLPAADRSLKYPSDESRVLCGPDPDGVRLARASAVGGDIYIVRAAGERRAGVNTDSDVAAAAGTIAEGVPTERGIIRRGTARERFVADGRVTAAADVEREGESAKPGVLNGEGVSGKGLLSECRVE